MELTFEQLNNQMEYLLLQFRRALNNGDYSSAKDTTMSVLQLYRDTYNVNLDTNPEFDHIFHEVMNRMQTELQNSRPTTEEAAKNEIEIIRMFSDVADGVFKVSEIRRRAMELQPSAEDLITAYEEGIRDADDQIERLGKLNKQYKAAYEVIYGKEIPGLQDKIGDEKFNVGTLDLIYEQITKMDELQRVIDLSEAEILADPSKEGLLRDKIVANQNELQNLLSDVVAKIDAMKIKGLNVDSIKDAADKDNTKRLAVQTAVITLKDKINDDLTDDYARLMDNIKLAQKRFGHIEQIANIDLTGIDPSTKEGRDKIDVVVNPFMELFDRIDKGLLLQNNRKKVYEQSIREVKEEQKILGIDTSDKSRYEDEMPDDVKNRMEAEKAYYRQDMMDKLYGNPEKAEQWKKYYALFYDARKIVPYTFADESGNFHDAEYMTIDYEKFSAGLARLTPPVSFDEAMKLLQLEEYKERMERVSKFQQGDKSVLKELPSYLTYRKACEEEGRATTEAEKNAAARKKAQAEAAMKQELKEDQIYVATNHGATDNNELIAKAIANAGSLVKYKKGRMLYKEQNTFGGKVKAFGHNYASLTGLRSVSDAKTMAGKIGTVALDAGLIALSPFNGAIKVVYRYFPVVGKEAQAKRFVKKHAGENSSPYEGRKDARKMKRRKEYKSEMNGIFKGARAWLKATNDDLFYPDRAKETEEAFCKRELEERVYPSVENRYILGAQTADAKKQQKARANLQKRQEDVRTVAGRAYGYNDMIRDPKSADAEEFEKQVILGAALEEHGEDAELLRYSKTDRPRDRRFVKETDSLEGILYEGIDSEDIDYSEPVGSVVQSDAIDRATREEGVNATYTARNFIPYTITGVATALTGRYVFSRMQTAVERILPGETEKVKTVVGYENYEKEIKIPHTSSQVDTSTVSRTPADFAAANNGQNVHLHRSVWGGEQGGYGVDLSGYDDAVGFYVEVPKDVGGVEKIALAIPQDAGKYDYLGQLVTKYGLDRSTLEKYIDVTTGTFRPDADLYDLAAEIANHTGATQNLTGDKLVEMVFSGTDAKAYVSSVVSSGSKNGGWFDVTGLGQQLGTKDIVTYTTKTVTRTRPVFEWQDVIHPGTKEVTKNTVRKAGMIASDILGAGNIVEAADKAIGTADPQVDKSRAESKRAKRQDYPEEVEPGRSRKAGRNRGGEER